MRQDCQDYMSRQLQIPAVHCISYYFTILHSVVLNELLESFYSDVCISTSVLQQHFQDYPIFVTIKNCPLIFKQRIAHFSTVKLITSNETEANCAIHGI